MLFVVPVNAYFGLLHRTLRGATFLNLVFLFCSPSDCQPSAMAEHLGIEFMGMEPSVLLLHPRVATKQLTYSHPVARPADPINPQLTDRSTVTHRDHKPSVSATEASLTWMFMETYNR